jgi:hypothetical protein
MEVDRHEYGELKFAAIIAVAVWLLVIANRIVGNE